MTGYQGHGLPERLTLFYRKIPEPVRTWWSMDTRGSSEAALEAIRDGGGWPEFRRHTRGFRFLPGYMAGAALRRAGLGSQLLATPAIQAAGDDWLFFSTLTLKQGALLGFLAGLQLRPRPGGYPANPPPSLSWRAGNK